MTPAERPQSRPLALGTLAVRTWDHAETPGATAVANGFKQNCTLPPARYEVQDRKVCLNLAIYVRGLAIRLQLGIIAIALPAICLTAHFIFFVGAGARDCCYASRRDYGGRAGRSLRRAPKLLINIT